MSQTHVKGKRNGRLFSYALNPKRAKAKLLKGAKRQNLDVEIKSGCVNLRFSDGAFFEVVLPLLKQWHGYLGQTFKFNDIEVNVSEADPGIDVTDKHMDTKLVVVVNNDRLVLHAYNGTQNLMIQGKNHENFAVKYLEPMYMEKINAAMNNIESFNSNLLEMFTQSKPVVKQPKGSKPFHCPECKVKATTVGNLRMHLKSSHSKTENKKKETKKTRSIMHEDLSLINDAGNSSITLDEQSEEFIEPPSIQIEDEKDEELIVSKPNVSNHDKYVQSPNNKDENLTIINNNYSVKIFDSLLSDKSFICGVCTEEFMMQNNYMLHMESHKEPSPLMCENCGKLFSTERELERHTETDHGQIYNNHQLCEGNKEGKTTKSNNVKKELLHSCKLCDYDTENIDDLQDHTQRNVHSVRNKSFQ